eukprot:GCRY01002040.1.p1 GENE.GCRY01002040.1~~GCRY01002040.1.p1  ORF type:complete len:551 (-),score=115.88 GCRY01002040.1:185-1837(-)
MFKRVLFFFMLLTLRVWCEDTNSSNDPSGFSDCTLPDIEHGTFDCDEPVLLAQFVESGTECTLSCASGFILAPSVLQLTCEDGNWDVEPPACIPETVCAVPTVGNGTIDCEGVSEGSLHVAVNTTCNIACNEGFDLSSKSTDIKCSETGLWDPLPLPSCIARSCGDLEIPHAQLSCNGQTMGSVCQVACDSPYVLSSVSLAQCTATGWSAPNCNQCEEGYFKDELEVCTACEIADSNCVMVNCTTAGDSYCVKCKEAYYLDEDQGGYCRACPVPEEFVGCTAVACGASGTVAPVCLACEEGFFLYTNTTAHSAECRVCPLDGAPEHCIATQCASETVTRTVAREDDDDVFIESDLEESGGEDPAPAPTCVQCETGFFVDRTHNLCVECNVSLIAHCAQAACGVNGTDLVCVECQEGFSISANTCEAIPCYHYSNRFCADLHRLPCNPLADQCGDCLYSYAGEPGPAATRCFLVSNSTGVSTSTIVTGLLAAVALVGLGAYYRRHRAEQAHAGESGGAAQTSRFGPKYRRVRRGPADDDDEEMQLRLTHHD